MVRVSAGGDRNSIVEPILLCRQGHFPITNREMFDDKTSLTCNGASLKTSLALGDFGRRSLYL
jgi:hypothetical protein